MNRVTGGAAAGWVRRARGWRPRVGIALALGLLWVVLGGATPVLAQGPDADITAPPPAAQPETSVFEEPGFIEWAMRFPERVLRGPADGTRPRNGFYPEFSNLPTGAGWISLGPGYRQTLFGGRALVDGSAAMSWRSYKMAQARVEFTNLTAARITTGVQWRWQDLTQVTYFGAGGSTPESARSEYRMQSANLVGYAAAHPRSWLSISGQAGWLDRPSILAPAGSFRRDFPDARTQFPNDAVYALDRQPSFLHGQLAIMSDTRDHPGHPTRGSMYRAGIAGYSDRDTGTFSFRRHELEGAQFLPLASDRVVLALHGWLVTSATSPGSTVPFYLLPSLGGANTLRAYTDYRFHDRHLVVLNAESRVALFAHVDAAVFVDAGNVAARIGDLNLDKRAYGIGVRLHSPRATFARVDYAHGGEGWRFTFRLTDPLSLARLSRRTAALPFVP